MKISTFNSFDKLVDEFINKTGLTLPRMMSGRKTFLSDIGQWANTTPETSGRELSSYILPNPSQGLSFPNAGDIISAALLLANGKRPGKEEIIDLMTEYALPVEKLTQPVTTLSGGEILLLNYAKTHAMATAVNCLYSCSPTYWLNKNKYNYWEKLVKSYAEKEIEVFLMKGEPFPGVEELTNVNEFSEIECVEWEVQFDEIKAVFEEISFPTFHPESSIQYRIKNSNKLKLSSPTLLTGDNGVGKSVFSKLISGILKSHENKPLITCGDSNRRVRLLFQDPINQLFAKGIEEHSNWIFSFSTELKAEAKRINCSILSNLNNVLGSKDIELTLLKAKVTLISERLATKPSLLILDEPGWGLSKEIGRHFIWSSCKVAAEIGVAMMFISHRPDWWKGLVKSHIHLSKHDDNYVVIENVGVDNG